MARLVALVLGAIAVTLTGCAVTAPATPPAPGDWQGMADQAVAALGKYRGRATVRTHAGDSLGDYYCKGSRIDLGTGGGNTTWLLAHELGHHLNGNCEGGSLKDEMDANAMAVKVLGVWGVSESAATYMTERHLLGLALFRKGGHPRPGHDYCAEVADLLKRYPATPDVRAGSECAS